MTPEDEATRKLMATTTKSRAAASAEAAPEARAPKGRAPEVRAEGRPEGRPEGRAQPGLAPADKAQYTFAPDETPAPRRILIAEDDDHQRSRLLQVLQSGNCQVDAVCNGAEALHSLDQRLYSVVLTDLRMPKLDGMELLRQIQQRSLPVSVIMMTGDSTIQEAVEALHLGAYDFLVKPIDVDNLHRVLQRALRERSLEDEVRSLRAQLRERYSFQNILSKNADMYTVFELIVNVADSNSTVLIEGETGTGKEQVARAIHSISSRSQMPLVAVNCAALPETLLESELFGHEKGAFTNAIGQRIGRFEMANGGTIFLDEIGDIPGSMQAKLLRVLQERRIERVGGTETIDVNVRVIAATNRSLWRMVQQKRFRRDLYYRLNVVKIDLPPLRKRPEDIPLLVTHFIQKFTRPGETPKQVSQRAMEVLLDYSWPGNIRQLENAVECACITSRAGMIEPDDLPPDIVNQETSKLPHHINLDRPLHQVVRTIVAEVEQQYIRKALQKAHGNVTRCALLCGLSRRAMTAKLSEYQIDKSIFKEM
jgi:DNA-binding NtrC family response regulator